MTDKIGDNPAYIAYRDIHSTHYPNTEEGKQLYYKRIRLFELEFPSFMLENQRPPKTDEQKREEDERARAYWATQTKPKK